MAAPPEGNLPELTVSELAFAVKRTVEEAFPYVRLRGEVSGYRGPHASGHCYFALKDENARVDAIIWKGTFGRLRFKPEEGLEVVATGKITTYPGRSTYQIVIESLEPAGIGALMALLEERRKKLAAEGLFDAARKAPLPYLPRVIGVVTSPTGAVIRDILHRLADRFPVHVLVWPARVQGDGAAEEVAAGIHGFNALAPLIPPPVSLIPAAEKLNMPDAVLNIPRPDLIIVARGGGSLEDLWAFNEEVVVRAAADSTIPLISAVGHETDWTLIDHAADIRAPTPTAAAEMAVPVRAELAANLGERAQRLRTGLIRLVQEAKAHLRAATRGLPRPGDLLGLPRQRFDATAGRLRQALIANTRAHGTRLARVSGRLSTGRIADRISGSRDRLDALAARSHRALVRRLERLGDRLDRLRQLLDTLGYEQTLARGFALVRDSAGDMVRSARGHAAGDRLGVQFADGTLPVAVEGDTPRPAKAKARPREKPAPAPGRQASLFEE